LNNSSSCAGAIGIVGFSTSDASRSRDSEGRSAEGPQGSQSEHSDRPQSGPFTAP